MSMNAEAIDFDLNYEYFVNEFVNFEEDFDEIIPDEIGIFSRFKYALSNCALPTVFSSSPILATIFFQSMFIKVLISKSPLSCTFIQTISILSSLSIICYFYQELVVAYLTLPVFALYILFFKLLPNRKNRLITCILVTGVHLLFGEVLIKRDKWVSIRGMEMLLIMKLVSYTVETASLSDDKLINMFGYSFSANVSIFGPWISYKEYKNYLCNQTKLLNLYKKAIQFKRAIGLLATSFLCLIGSNCLLNVLEDFFEERTNNFFFFTMFFHALSFRLSNYFICFFSQSICVLSEMRCVPLDKKTKSNHDQYEIANPFHVELPFSMLKVVTNWNLPMHHWLKKYVFQESKKTFGTKMALVFTYVASALLHGSDLNLALVLFSLGLFSYIEYNFRTKLEKNFVYKRNVQSGQEQSNNKHDEGRVLSKLISIFFLALNVYNLAYLGDIFYSSFNESDDNQTTSAFKIWSQTYFSGHLATFALFVLSVFM